MTLAGLLAGWRRPAPARSTVAARQGSVAPAVSSGRTARSVARTHVGRVRQINEDRVFEHCAHGLWAVADGMGGHFAGDIAAEAVVEALRALAESRPTLDAAAIGATLVDAGRRIHAETAGSQRVSGATIVALHIDGDRATLFWAGDSRAYRVRDRRLEQLSRDHSVVQDLVDAGALTPEQADRHPHAHVITRALGVTPDIDIEQARLTVLPGDLYLLCSDGLTRGNAGTALPADLDRPLGDIADALLADALATGGADNISLILIAPA